MIPLINIPNLKLPCKRYLFMEFHGTENGVKEQSQLVQEIAKDNGGEDFQWTTDLEERNKLWAARHDVTYASKAKTWCDIWATDVCVPISKLAECISATKKDLSKSSLRAPLVSHAGDGNFHLGFVIDRDNPKR